MFDDFDDNNFDNDNFEYQKKKRQKKQLAEDREWETDQYPFEYQSPDDFPPDISNTRDNNNCYVGTTKEEKELAEKIVRARKRNEMYVSSILLLPIALPIVLLYATGKIIDDGNKFKASQYLLKNASRTLGKIAGMFLLAPTTVIDFACQCRADVYHWLNYPSIFNNNKKKTPLPKNNTYHKCTLL